MADYKKRYAISAGHQDTLEAAETILENGGNAVDAAIAAFLVSMVCEPCMSSPGGGAIALVKTPNEKIFSCDFFCQTPQQKKSKKEETFYPVTIDFGGTTEDFYIGAGSIAVPGSIAGVFRLHQDFGKMPLRELFFPAIELANNGAEIDSFQEYDIFLLEDILGQEAHGRKRFFTPQRLKKKGDRLHFPGLADFFDVLSIEGHKLFYEGEIASKIAEVCLEKGGHVTIDDLKNYKPVIEPADLYQIRDLSIYTVKYPSKGGPLIAYILDQLSREMIGNPFSSKHLEVLTRVIKEGVLIKSNPKELAKYIENRFGRIPLDSGASKSGGTTHITIEDATGMAISLTTSIGEGSGVWIPDADMQLNNMLGEEALMENGFYNWRENVRLMTMMTPTMVNKEREWLLTGTGGAGRIPYAIAQLIHYVFDLGMSLWEATSSPRVFYQDPHFEVERGFERIEKDLFRYWDEHSLFFGGTNSIWSNGLRINAVADIRRLGSATS
jgi:gamma-glutamyltranspeptidase/glutathione hydrolase